MFAVAALILGACLVVIVLLAENDRLALVAAVTGVLLLAAGLVGL